MQMKTLGNFLVPPPPQAPAIFPGNF
jgi:hypothetical protein